MRKLLALCIALAAIVAVTASSFGSSMMALTLAWLNPITLDASGRVPQIFCADGNIKIRLTDRNGVTQIVQDNLLVVGPSGGGGGGGIVDPTTIATTGDFKASYSTGTLTGWVNRETGKSQAYGITKDLRLVVESGEGT
jgi:hypothetical protein